MTDDINPAVIKLTQETLGKYVKKPSLSEKLLRKPPFRFLHDVFVVVIRDTGCFAGLYTAEELKSDNIKDRDDKMKFLQKMIDVVRICTNVPLTVKTSKIVAGHEAEKTNELLQLMGKIIEDKLNWQPAVEQVLRGKDTKAIDKPAEKKKETDMRSKEPKMKKDTTKMKQPSLSKEHKSKMPKEKEKTSVAKKEPLKGVKSNDKNRRLSKDATKPKLTKTDSEKSHANPSPKKEAVVDATKSSQNEKECNHEEETAAKEENKTNASEPVSDQQEPNNKENVQSDEVAITNQSAEPEIMRTNLSAKTKSVEKEEANHLPVERENHNSRKSSPKYSSKTVDAKDVEVGDTKTSPDKDNSNSIETSNNFQNSESKSESKQVKMEQQSQPSTVFNSEMRRESTFTRDDSKELPNPAAKPSRPKTSLRPPSARPPSARPGAPRRRDRNVEIILQPNDQVKMSGIQVKLETFGDLEDDGENLVIIENVNATELSDQADMGTMDSQSVLAGETIEQGHLVHQILETQKELTQQNDLDQQIKNEKNSANGNLVMKQTSTHHMNNLRDVIQNLTKSINPLGKLMDFIPEDIDAMQLEFTMWRDTYTQAANQLKREKSLTESATEPMKNQLVQIEANILEYMEMIDASRVKILQNNEKIVKMLTMS